MLVVDDDADTRNSLAELLDLWGYAATTTEGPTAVALARDEQPAAILLDLLMPVVDGFEVLEQLRWQESTRDIPVICLTGLAHARQRVEQGGATAFLLKPVQPAELRSTLERLVGPAAARQTVVRGPAPPRKGRNDLRVLRAFEQRALTAGTSLEFRVLLADFDDQGLGVDELEAAIRCLREEGLVWQRGRRIFWAGRFE